MKKLATIIAVVALSSAAFAAGGGAKRGTRTEEAGRIEGAGTKITGEGVGAKSTLRSNVGDSTAAEQANIVDQAAVQAADTSAQQLGGTCASDTGFNELSKAERTVLADAKDAGILGNKCAPKFGAKLIKRIVEMKNAGLGVIRGFLDRNGDGKKTLADAKDNAEVLNVSKAEAGVLVKHSVVASIAQGLKNLRETCKAGCDLEGNGQCAALAAQ